jgi:hypothetical protein
MDPESRLPPEELWQFICYQAWMASPAERRKQLPDLRDRFSTSLAAADDIAFLRMIWTLNALQTNRAEVAARFLNGFPPEAATAGIILNSGARSAIDRRCMSPPFPPFKAVEALTVSCQSFMQCDNAVWRMRRC